ncbi:MAG: hypothetical protein M1826_007701 [Phylliscum demangeonii]|nr:MAG: hypothetical protein M1826_007701 [Phylliscum demangeonii]
MSAACHVVIVGAGLGGLATAISLRKAGHDHDVTVLEQASEWREVGAGIQIPPNASRILRQWGLLEAIEARSIQPTAIVLRSYQTGEVLSTQNVVPHMQASYGAPFLVIHRADYHRILREAVAAGAAIRLGATVAAIDFSSPAVQLATGERLAADAIIGADGERSACRDLLLQRADPVRPSGELVFRMLIPAAPIRRAPRLKALVEPAVITGWVGPGAHVVSYLLAKDDMMFNVVLTRPDPHPDQPATGGPQPADLAELAAFLADWDPRLAALLSLAQATLKWTLLQLYEMPSWRHAEGRMML